MTGRDGGWVFALHGRDAESFPDTLCIIACQDMWNMCRVLIPFVNTAIFNG